MSLDGEEALKCADNNDFLGLEWRLDLSDEDRIVLVHDEGLEELHLVSEGYGLYVCVCVCVCACACVCV